MKINLVAAGGTIDSRIIGGESVISNEATSQIASFIGANAVFDDFKMHSADAGLDSMYKLQAVIARALDGADGVIVTHGTDTLAYSAAYLAFRFSSTKIPIVLCAADLPLTDDDSNGYDVLSAATSFISRGESGVFVMYKNPGEVVRIHHGARLIPAHMHENFYFSLNGVRKFIDTGLMRGMKFELSEKRVLLISPYVGMDYDSYNLDGYQAVVHAAYHSGRINIAALNAFAQKHADIPVFFLSGNKRFPDKVFQKNIVLCPGITQSALYIKLLIGLENKVKDLKTFIKKNACGEIVI